MCSQDSNMIHKENDKPHTVVLLVLYCPEGKTEIQSLSHLLQQTTTMVTTTVVIRSNEITITLAVIPISVTQVCSSHINVPA